LATPVATSASAVAVDGAGNLFVADWRNNRVRRVDATSRTISTFAGNGFASFGGDGDVATGAILEYPDGIAFDRAGNLYIADGLNARVRRVGARTGIIMTVAGTGLTDFNGDDIPAVQANLFAPIGLAFDVQGNLYVVDVGALRIRRIDARGRITTVAGFGGYGTEGDGGLATEAHFLNLRSVAFDAAGNFYIVDLDDHRVRKVDARTGIIATVAGTGVAGFSGDGDRAADAQLSEPWDVAIDAAGNVYIAGASNNLIRFVKR
jgi:trimeric autotransporter adhesin